VAVPDFEKFFTFNNTVLKLQAACAIRFMCNRIWAHSNQHAYGRDGTCRAGPSASAVAFIPLCARHRSSKKEMCKCQRLASDIFLECFYSTALKARNSFPLVRRDFMGVGVRMNQE